MVAKGGAKLINEAAVIHLKKKLIKKTFLITPNVPEAEVLTRIKIKNSEDMIEAGKNLINLGAKNVLIKGGHIKSKYINDIFLNSKEIKIFRHRLIKTKNTHGTGCTLSAAISGYLAKNYSLPNAVKKAKEFVSIGIKKSLDIGSGCGPLNHFPRS